VGSAPRFRAISRLESFVSLFFRLSSLRRLSKRSRVDDPASTALCSCFRRAAGAGEQILNPAQVPPQREDIN
jgi:hypothetical protein